MHSWKILALSWVRKGSGVRSSSHHWRELHNYHPFKSLHWVLIFFTVTLPVSDSTRSVPGAKSDILNLSFPVRKAGGSDFKIFTPVFWFVFVLSLFSQHIRTEHQHPYPGLVVALHVQYWSADLKICLPSSYLGSCSCLIKNGVCRPPWARRQAQWYSNKNHTVVTVCWLVFNFFVSCFKTLPLIWGFWDPWSTASTKWSLARTTTRTATTTDF